MFHNIFFKQNIYRSYNRCDVAKNLYLCTPKTAYMNNNDTFEESNPSVVQVGKIELSRVELSKEPDYHDLPLLVVRNFVLFPGCTSSIVLTREAALEVAHLAQKSSIGIGVVCQTDDSEEEPETVKQVAEYGVITQVLQIVELPDGRNIAIVHSFDKFKIIRGGDTPAGTHKYLTASVRPVKELVPGEENPEFMVLGKEIFEVTEKICKSGSDSPEELMMNLRQVTSPCDVINMVATYAGIAVSDKLEMLKCYRVKERGLLLLKHLNEAIQFVRIQEEIRQKTGARITEEQRQIFMRKQIETIKDELGENDDDCDKLREGVAALQCSDEVRDTIYHEIDRLTRLAPMSPDYAVLHSYIKTLIELPWGITDPSGDDINNAAAILDNDHYGLTKVKRRILEQLAVLINKPDVKASIICLVGAPGVGKTSIGQSIAHALGRKYQRVSLGGVSDEAEIRGHRRTYIGAMPGRIIDAVRRAATSNPVILLDEVDKLGRDHKGDPSAALLEVLDPEQNCHFHDNYIDIDFDLSKIVFIATANTLSTLPRPLLDRMEVIEISGYLPQEKLQIARKHLLPRLMESNDLDVAQLVIPDETIASIIERYTAESGVRQLEKALASVVRHFILRRVQDSLETLTVTPGDLRGILGLEMYQREAYENNDFAGHVTGLAWTEVGGETLSIESLLIPAKEGGHLTLTGNLGNVMKESATIALQYVRAHAGQLGINPELFTRYDVHIHVPEGATPKDGPSAGITMATSLISLFTQHRVRERLAMTGEITLRGKILPVGGIKEKILAAKRAGITDIVISEHNRKDIEDIGKAYIDGLTFHYVGTMLEAASVAMTQDAVKDALTL